MTDKRLLPIEVVVIVNEAGEYVVAGDEATADDLADGIFGEDDEIRYVTLKFKLLPPSAAPVAVQTYEFEIERSE